LDVISPSGEPKEPKKAADIFRKQCGVMVRDHVPITVRDWRKRKGAKDNDYVAERYKKVLWDDLMAHFTLPELDNRDDTAKLREKVKEWTLKKMAELFRVWKKRLWRQYLKKKTAPVFEGYLSKQANHWNAFKEYKESEDAQEMSKKNKRNAAKKKYHHTLGAGGYETAMPKWDKKEQELLDKGIQPEWMREEWELRARNWFLAHGGSYDETTGDLVCSDGVHIPRDNWLKVVKEIKDGKRKFHPDREKDMLTLVLGNEEKGGRCRGLGATPWWLGFAKDVETYRSRARSKRRREEEGGDKFSKLLARIDNQQQQIDELRGVVRLQDPAVDITAGPSQRRSSVGESEVPANDARGYPVDGIEEQSPCELHQKMKNISMKVAVGYVLPCPAGTRWHGREIPHGYAKVGVDDILTGFHGMELDIPGPEEERTLGEVKGGIILWDKNNIKLPAGSTPRPTPRPSRPRSPAPPLPSPPPLTAKDNKRKGDPSTSTNQHISPKRQPLTRVPHKNPEPAPVLEKSKSSKSESGEKSSKSASGKIRDVPQLPQQNMEEAAKWADSMGLRSVAELLCSQDAKIPKADGVAPKYVPGNPLVDKERFEQLPTEMRNLHEWYSKWVKHDFHMTVVQVPYEYYFRADRVHVEFTELFQLYNFDALGKSLMSCYCL